ncbi:MAG: hypothetical protein OXF26_09475 [Alphaproteobacteria bacterium]|nr:hypothetical protein [Alphaproteobacteria bacterium]MCY4231082.1 hypothetical protein [Alphaproteobacteria bacterium]
MGRGHALALANGWRLARRRLMGANRVETDVQQIRIVIQGLADHVPTALIALNLDDALSICDKLKRRLGYDREAWQAMAAASDARRNPGVRRPHRALNARPAPPHRLNIV